MNISELLATCNSLLLTSKNALVLSTSTMSEYYEDSVELLNSTRNVEEEPMNPLIKLLCDKIESSKTQKSIDETYSKLVKLNLIKYAYPCLFLFGIMGNILSLIVMIRVCFKNKHFKIFAFSLAILAVADLTVLIFGCLREYAEEILNIQVRSFSSYSCKIFFFTCYLFSYFSAYLHAFIAFERWNAISRPIKTKQNFSFNTNRIIIIIIFILCVIFNFPFFWLSNLEKTISIDYKNSTNNMIDVNIINECKIVSSDNPGDYYYDLILILTDTVIYCLLPFMITILFSFLTLITLINSKTKKSDAANIRINSSKANKSNLKITAMLMALPISYLITTFPIFLIILKGFKHVLFNNKENVFKNDTINNDIEFSITKAIMYINNSINILIYVFLGKTLRNDFLGISFI